MEQAHSTSGLPGLGRLWTRPSGVSRLRVVPWQGDRYTALVGPRRDGRSPRAVEIRTCLDVLRSRGVARAVTPAMSSLDSQPFLEAGFGLHERLHLLARPIAGPAPTPSRRLQTGRPWHRSIVLDIDQRAFDAFWRFDATTLREARRATPASRFRVSRASAVDRRHPGAIVGYAITGRAAQRGYLQRLAVDPSVAGQGHGSDLVHDAIDWLHRRGATTVLVNTQETNTRALALYERLGFIRQTEGLLVLGWDVPQ